MAVSLALIALLGLLANYLFEKAKLPGLLGMLFVGIMCGPFVFDIIQPELLKVSADLRMIALIVLLLRAGLELRRDTLNRVGRPALLLSCVPATFEGVAITVLAPSLLGITYLESAILAFILSAVSLAVVVPLMIRLIGKNRGTEKGIPTLLLSASSGDNVFVILIFTTLLGMYFGTGGPVWLKLLEIPESIIFGIIVGAVTGYILCHVFERYKLRATKMTIIIISVAIMLIWLEETVKTKVAMSALLGIMVVGLIILEKTEIRAHKISQKLAKVWIFAEILLFVLVGAQVDVEVAWTAGIAGSILIFTALIARSIGTYISLAGTDLDLREKLFCVISYIPKATVQAAIGAVPMEMGVEGGDVILAVAVLSILLTAPLGAIGITLTGEKWLSKDPPPKKRLKTLFHLAD
jgi:NhaP-type Na+/H+ or K+/H+ antiporter